MPDRKHFQQLQMFVFVLGQYNMEMQIPISNSSNSNEEHFIDEHNWKLYNWNTNT